MVDAPERIWTYWSDAESEEYDIVGYDSPQKFGQEYVRADLYEKEKKAAQALALEIIALDLEDARSVEED